MTACYNQLHDQVLDRDHGADVQMHWPVSMGAMNQAAAIMYGCCHQLHKDDSGMAYTWGAFQFSPHAATTSPVSALGKEQGLSVRFECDAGLTQVPQADSKADPPIPVLTESNNMQGI